MYQALSGGLGAPSKQEYCGQSPQGIRGCPPRTTHPQFPASPYLELSAPSLHPLGPSSVIHCPPLSECPCLVDEELKQAGCLPSE